MGDRSEHHANDTVGCPVLLAADNACLYVTGRCKGGGKAAWLLYNGVDEGCIVERTAAPVAQPIGVAASPEIACEAIVCVAAGGSRR